MDYLKKTVSSKVNFTSPGLKERRFTVKLAKLIGLSFFKKNRALLVICLVVCNCSINIIVFFWTEIHNQWFGIPALYSGGNRILLGDT